MRRRVSFSCLSYVRRLSCVCLLTVRRAKHGCLSHDCHRTECRTCFAMLDVTRVMSSGWLSDYLVRVSRLNRYINGSNPYASILCIARYPSIARDLDLLRSAFMPSARSSKGILHTIQDLSRKSSVCAQGSSANSSTVKDKKIKYFFL